MGIRGLTKIIMNIQKTYPYVKYRGKIIAIDVNILIYKFCHMYHDSIPHFIEIFVHKICSFLKFGIYPVFIFDGNAPKEKHAIIKKRLSTKKKYRQRLDEINKDCVSSTSTYIKKLQKKAFVVTKEHRTSLTKLLESMNIPYYIAQGEAEVLCALLQQAGQVDLTLSDDTDAIVYGCTRTLKMLRNSERYLIETDMDHLLLSQMLTKDEFLNACVLTGCDYLNKKNSINIETCIKYVREYHTLEKTLQELKKINKMHSYEEYKHIKDMYQFNTSCTTRIIQQQQQQGHYILKRLKELQLCKFQNIILIQDYLQQNKVPKTTIEHLINVIKNSINDFLIIRFNLFSTNKSNFF